MINDNNQSINFGETGEEAQESIAEAGEQREMPAEIGRADEVEADVEIGEAGQENIVMASMEVDGAMENETAIGRLEAEETGTAGSQVQEVSAVLNINSEVEVETKKNRDSKSKTMESSGPRENESAIAWLERLERESRAADEKVKLTKAALKSAREVEAEAKRQAAHTRKRLKIANQQVRETLDAKYCAECSAEQVIGRLQVHKIEAAKSAADQAVNEAKERARYEFEELKWKSKKAEQEAKFSAKWEAETSGEPGEKKPTASKSVGEVKAEARREAAQIKERLQQAMLQAKREAQDALDRAKKEVDAAGQEISQEAKERIEKLHVAILRAIANRNEIKLEADIADERAIKKAEALKSVMEDYAEAKREAAEARKRLREAMSMARSESKEARDKAKRKAKEATMLASGNELSGYVRLQIARPITPGPIREFELALAQSSSFRVESVGGTVDEGAYIDVFIDEPVHLLGILSEMPHIESFWKNDKGIKVELNTAAAVN